jgi:hypothetical protein
MVIEGSGNRKWVNTSTGGKVPVIRTDEEYDWAGTDLNTGAADINEYVRSTTGKPFGSRDVEEYLRQVGSKRKEVDGQLKYLRNRGLITRDEDGWRLTAEGLQRAKRRK